MRKKKNKHGSLSNVFYMIREVFRISPSYVILNLLSTLASSLPAKLIPVIGIKFIIDAAGRQDSVRYIITGIIAMVGLFLICNLFDEIYDVFFSRKISQKIEFEFNRRIYEHAHSLDLSSYDNAEFYNDVILALESGSDPTSAADLAIDYLSSIISLIALGSIIISYDLISLFIIAAFSLVSIPLNLKLVKTDTERFEQRRVSERKENYYARIFWLRDYAEEIKMNDIKSLLFRKYDESAENTISVERKNLKKSNLMSLAAHSVSEILGSFLILTAYLGYRTIIAKTMTPGEFAATFNGSIAITGCVTMLSDYSIYRINYLGELVEKLRHFFEIKPSISDGEHVAECGDPEKIIIRNVSFKYQGNDSKTLDGINLEIEPGEKLAIVGFNGAGKTTLTNLLLRLYDVDEGEITIGGRNIKDETVESHRKRFACAFQDFQIFAATVGENVAMDVHYDKERVLDSLKNADFRKELPDGTETALTKEFDENGLGLSGGEEQKIVISRTFYKQCPYVIMDEPSANLDPYAEYELNRRINDTLKNRTVIFISHRLSTTRHADKIAMMEQGKIIELGTHDELMALNGKYAELFNMQAEKYLAE